MTRAHAAWLLGGMLALAAAAGACQPAPQAAPRDVDLARGETLVRRHCAGCHAVEQQDTSPLRGAPPLRDLHRRYEPEMLAEALAEGILTGHPAMPAFSFPPSDVQAIIRYLDSVQSRQKS
ncbi:MAG: cytochrome c [Phenylobacterium sp.]|uniref:c-type cytochrome n=1 Tax=Phenylobacterium sp. TaxID=1871053 RepID=UPI001A490A43|nr:cytochrome c [Phenylobacterium sp.]MBL8772642.1 cytochrome c [Phenylobacterium sp.]